MRRPIRLPSSNKHNNLCESSFNLFKASKMSAWAFLVVLVYFSRPAIAIFGASNETDFWEDFANNFATDLAPIISLFSEKVTKQFLSESTTILDTILFTVRPLGILTTIMSCIRVRGGLFLRSIVGRAREPHGAAEIEPCSSTSQDVCELWSNGGVCRVFGRPKILEFIYHPTQDPKQFYADTEFPATCGIVLARDFFQGLALHSEFSRDPKYKTFAEHWKEISNNKILWTPFSTAKALKRPNSHDSENPVIRHQYGFAPFPNLALNIGVQHTMSTVSSLWLATIFGVLLQASFFGYATWATWYYPGFYTEGRVPNTNVFFAFTMTGTVLIVTGMALCASLIDGNSMERRFYMPQPKDNRVKCRFFWLQPGGQRIGDQEFEAFAHDEVKTDYITSWKANSGGRISHTLVYLATGFSFVGWAIQFIGLRGQHATISLYQLCCTVIMSTIRAFMRSYRGTPKNKLESIQEFTRNHELDWQATCLAQDSTGGRDLECGRGSHIRAKAAL
ncbi:hypothetical protein F53441_9678 [Fusarium austroafricanum]|uniref:Uncharacterized protein n=1 Tax=Fusarium austroafricanum TaxID=2364996 RepID=A0A8H4NQ05_9HYPO|nr:hypothetical protein F53441_9678 [Fusarium austroafricanum]